MTNELRIERATRAIVTYEHQHGTDDSETLLIDLLADLQHWCDQEGLNFFRATRIATGHYKEEK